MGPIVAKRNPQLKPSSKIGTSSLIPTLRPLGKRLHDTYLGSSWNERNSSDSRDKISQPRNVIADCVILLCHAGYSSLP